MSQLIKIKNEVSLTTIDIEGTIGMEEAWQFDNPDSRVATYERFRESVSQIADIQNSEIRVNIRSTGGDVNDAILIYEALRATGAKVTTCCYGYTASAATIVAQAASEGCRLIAPSSLYLIHNSICATEGNAEELQAEVEMLHQTDMRLADIYATRSGRDVEEIKALMAENGGRGKWLSPEEAIAMGLVDAVEDVVTPTTTFTERTKQAVVALLNHLGITTEASSPEPPHPADDVNIVVRNSQNDKPLVSPKEMSLIALKEAQRNVEASKVKSVQDPNPVDLDSDPRKLAYESDARKMRLR
ncbi:MAG: Clp protease ClpP [Alistipes sp.]|nr:Clp protease ClpP [Alistipes sp.]